MATGLLKGVGFIIGSATGIGRSTGFAFAHAGVRGLVLADIDVKGMDKTASEIRKEHPNLEVVTLPVDTASEESCVVCMKEAFGAFGRIDYVLNNVGIGGNMIPTTHQTKDELMKVLHINFVGLWVSQREQIRHMLTQEPLDPMSGRGVRGAITNTASILGLVGGPDGSSPYVASKHAIVGLTKTESATYAKQGIRINSICPGYVSTPILGNNIPEVRAAIEQAVTPKIPLGRLGYPEEIADCVVFLSSPLASYVHGASLAVDGGYTAI